MNMRKVRIFLRAMREGMDVTSIFGGDAPRLPLGTTRFGHSRIGSQADDWAATGGDLYAAMKRSAPKR